MEQQNKITGMLELILRPAFCVQGGSVVQVNHPAQSRGIVPGTPISELLVTGAEEYAVLNGSCLYLTLCVEGSHFGASVTQVDGFDIFVLTDTQPELQALALDIRVLTDGQEEIELREMVDDDDSDLGQVAVDDRREALESENGGDEEIIEVDEDDKLDMDDDNFEEILSDDFGDFGLLDDDDL